MQREETNFDGFLVSFRCYLRRICLLIQNIPNENFSKKVFKILLVTVET